MRSRRGSSMKGKRWSVQQPPCRGRSVGGLRRESFRETNLTSRRFARRQNYSYVTREARQSRSPGCHGFSNLVPYQHRAPLPMLVSKSAQSNFSPDSRLCGMRPQRLPLLRVRKAMVEPVPRSFAVPNPLLSRSANACRQPYLYPRY